MVSSFMDALQRDGRVQEERGDGMSILIQGMEMPQGNSTINVLIYADGTVYTGHVNDSQYSAVSVHTPHGRLIDADELIDGCEKLMRMLDPESKEYLRVFAIKSYLMWAAEYVVIEAEGE